MEKVRNLLRKPGFSLFVFFVSLLLFNWPLLTIAHNSRPTLFILYLFSAWALIILLLFFISKSYGNGSSDNGRTDKRGL